MRDLLPLLRKLGHSVGDHKARYGGLGVLALVFVAPLDWWDRARSVVGMLEAALGPQWPSLILNSWLFKLGILLAIAYQLFRLSQLAVQRETDLAASAAAVRDESIKAATTQSNEIIAGFIEWKRCSVPNQY